MQYANCFIKESMVIVSPCANYKRLIQPLRGSQSTNSSETLHWTYISQFPSLFYVRVCCNTNREFLAQSACCSSIQVGCVHSPERVSLWSGLVVTVWSLSEVSLWLLCSHLAQRSRISGREHFRVPSNFSERTRCENALNLPDASSGVVLSISAFPLWGWLAYLISLISRLLHLKEPDRSALLCHTSLCRHDAAVCLISALQCKAEWRVSMYAAGFRNCTLHHMRPLL